MRRRLQSLTIVGVALIAFPALAQDAERQGRHRQPVVSLSFPGGTIAEYANALTEAAPGANILLASEETGQIPLPPIELQDVGLDTAIEAVAGERWLDQHNRVKVHVQTFYGTGSGTPVFRIEGAGAGRRPWTEVCVWSLSGLLDDQTAPEDVLTAVETAVDLAGKSRPAAVVKYHAATSLILAQGSEDQLMAIERVVDALRQGHEQRLEASREASNAEANDLRQHVRELEMALQELTHVNHRLEERHDELAQENARLSERLQNHPAAQ